MAFEKVEDVKYPEEREQFPIAAPLPVTVSLDSEDGAGEEEFEV